MATVMNKADIGPHIQPSLDSNSFTITKSDTVDLPSPICAIHVGGAGNVTYMKPDGTVDVLNGCLAGTQYMLDAKRIMAATTATLMTGLVYKGLR